MIVWNVGGVLGALSSLALIALGTTLLRLKPLRAAQVAFALVALFWGGGTLAANLSLLTDSVTVAEPLVYALVAFQLPLHAALLAFALLWPWPSERVRASPLLWGALAIPSVLMLSLLAARPSLFVEDVVLGPSGLPRTLTGPLWLWVVPANTFIAFELAFIVLWVRRRQARDAEVRSAIGLLQAGLLTYLSYQASQLLLLFEFGPGAFGGVLAPQFLYALGWAGGAVALSLGAVVVAWRDKDAPWRDLTLAAGLLPALVGVAEVSLYGTGAIRNSTLGLWRLATVSIITYGIARHRLFDLDLRLSELARPVGSIATAFLLLLFLGGVVGDELVAEPLFGVLALAGVALIAIPAPRVVARIVHGPQARPASATAVAERRVAVYRMAVAEAMERGWDGVAPEPFLEALRSDLAIAEETHVALLLGLERQTRVDTRGRPVRDDRHPAGASSDRFDVREELGRGAHGRTVLAYDQLLERKVVIKWPSGLHALDPNTRDAFLREARLMARVKHPNVLTVHEILQDPDGLALVLEFMEGGSLGDHLRVTGTLSEADACKLMTQVLDGLEALHDAGIVHRDVKPDNILLDGAGGAKVADLGVARDEAVEAMPMEGGDPVGSLATMSPEQLRDGHADARSDVYGAAATLYRAIVGQYPFPLEHVHIFEVHQRILTEPPVEPPASAMSRPLWALVRSCLAKRADDRPATAAEFREALAPFAAGGEALTTGPRG